ncbi:MAG: glycine zipper family protein [Roseovarius sp.]
MNTFKITCLTALIALGAACADTGARYTPVVDGTRNANFTTDLGACQGLARSQPVMDGETGNAVLVGAGIGAALGAVDDDADALGGAVAGALGGVLADTVKNPGDRKAIVVNCMRQRGHKVAG